MMALKDKATSDSLASQFLPVELNATFGAWQLRQKRQLLEDFNFTHRQPQYTERVCMQVREGACLSVLGLISYDVESGTCQMTSLAAILAGGIREAQRYLDCQIAAIRDSARFFGALSAVAFAVTGVIGYTVYMKYQQEQQLKESIQKSKMDIHKMPTVRADEMGTHCLICLTNPSNIVLIPCNHLCICSECFLKYKENQDARRSVKCPMCRLEVDLERQILIIYDQERQMEKQATQIGSSK